MNLPTYTITGIEESQNAFRINVISTQIPQCPYCHSTDIVGFGRREQVVLDFPKQGKRVDLHINTRRFKCNPCSDKQNRKVVFYEPLSDLDSKRAMTRRLSTWVSQQSVKQTFASVAEKAGCTEGTIRAIFKDYVQTLNATHQFETPTSMGIGDLNLIHSRAVISNVQTDTLVELLPTQSAETIRDYLSGLEGREKVSVVVMCMRASYRTAVEVVMPHARIVIGQTHVLAMASAALERVRKTYRQSLTLKQRRELLHDHLVLNKREHDLTEYEVTLLARWTCNHPILGLAYQLKENFCLIYDAKTSSEALARFSVWEQSVTPEVGEAFSDLIKTWREWQPHILAYFNLPAKDACLADTHIEDLNKLQDAVDHVERRYSFEAMRVKILFAEGAFKHVAADKLLNKEINYGVEIPPLICLLSDRLPG